MDAPVKVPLGELDSAYTGLVFPGSEPEKPDLSGLVMDSTIPQEVRERILLVVEISHQTNLWRTKALDKKFRDLYTAAAKVVNNVSEAGNCYRRVALALSQRQQIIVRKSGPFVKATTSAAPVRVR